MIFLRFPNEQSFIDLCNSGDFAVVEYTTRRALVTDSGLIEALDAAEVDVYLIATHGGEDYQAHDGSWYRLIEVSIVTAPNIDVVGIITQGGTYDEDGNVIVPPIAIEGYHVNAITIPPEWEQYVIDRPNKPYRIFAGQ